MYQILPLEDRWITDPQTGQKIHQLTSHASIQHHPFFLSPTWDDAMRHIAVISDRTGHNQLYLCRTSDYALIRISEVEEVDEWTIHPSRDGRYIYYHGDAKAIRTECSSGKSEVLLTEEEASRLCGGVGKAVFPTGRTTALRPLLGDSCAAGRTFSCAGLRYRAGELEKRVGSGRGVAYAVLPGRVRISLLRRDTSGPGLGAGPEDRRGTQGL